jgi:hypothetical protein
MTIPEAAYIQLRRRPPEYEQGNARNMYRILINVLYVNKKELCASSWRSTKIITRDIAPFMFRTQENFDTKDGGSRFL